MKKINEERKAKNLQLNKSKRAGITSNPLYLLTH